MAAHRALLDPAGSINAPALTETFRQLVANNRAGGWRKLKRER